MTALTVDSAERLRLALSPDFVAERLRRQFPDGAQLEVLSSDGERLKLELTSDGSLVAQCPDGGWVALSAGPSPDYREAEQYGIVRPHVQPDDPGKVPGKTACTWCGRSPSAAPMTTIEGRPVTRTEHVDPRTLEHHVTTEYGEPYRGELHCTDDGDCQAARSEREEGWADQQQPAWRAHLRAVLDAERKRLEASERTAYGWYHPQEMARQRAELEAQERQVAALAREFRPPDSFYSDLAVALGRRRDERDELELAAAHEGEGIFGPVFDQPPPAPWAMLPDPWAHTMRAAHNRAHTIGHMRRYPGVVSGADGLARKAVTA